MEGGITSSTPERLSARYTHLHPTKNNASDCVSIPGKHYTAVRQNHNWTGLLSPAPTSSLVNGTQNRQQQQQKIKPPLLPLPVTSPYKFPPRALSCSPTKKKMNNTNMKKSKPSATSHKKDPKMDFGSKTRADTNLSEFLTMAPTTTPLGPDPNDLPKNVSRVLSPSTSSFQLPKDHKDLEKFSDSIYTLSPPPSSLPLPKFSLRPKLGCNSRVSGINPGTTDNLRRLLKLP